MSYIYDEDHDYFSYAGGSYISNLNNMYTNLRQQEKSNYSKMEKLTTEYGNDSDSDSNQNSNLDSDDSDYYIQETFFAGNVESDDDDLSEGDIIKLKSKVSTKLTAIAQSDLDEYKNRTKSDKTSDVFFVNKSDSESDGSDSGSDSEPEELNDESDSESDESNNESDESNSESDESDSDSDLLSDDDKDNFIDFKKKDLKKPISDKIPEFNFKNKTKKVIFNSKPEYAPNIELEFFNLDLDSEPTKYKQDLFDLDSEQSEDDIPDLKQNDFNKKTRSIYAENFL